MPCVLNALPRDSYDYQTSYDESTVFPKSTRVSRSYQTLWTPVWLRRGRGHPVCRGVSPNPEVVQALRCLHDETRQPFLPEHRIPVEVVDVHLHLPVQVATNRGGADRGTIGVTSSAVDFVSHSAGQV